MSESETKPKRKFPGTPHIRLAVTEDIIRNSISRDSSHCMLAEAVKLAFPEGTSISVDIQTIRVSNPKKQQRYTYLTPRLAQVALIKFDQGIMPEPFEVSLRSGQVTRMHSSADARAKARTDRVVSAKSLAAIDKAAESNPLKQATLVERQKGVGNVHERIGGRTPPVQRTKDNVPFSKRRSFGLRGMDR